jgi:O-methyltransferase involved in polyketide biosynthesis
MIDRSSRTAEHVALFRALETVRPGGGLFRDPPARRLLPRRHRTVVALSRLPGVHGALVRYIDRRWSGGPRASAVVRTRLIDEWLAEALTGGARQVVLLGAGFDSRAHRASLTGVASPAGGAVPADGGVAPAAGGGSSSGGVAYFEVDHPATQATKRRRLGRDARPGVVFAPADLTVDDLGTVLRAAGFDPALRTTVIWEGVTNYLDAASVDATLRGLAALCPPGSTVIFTYVDRGVLDGTATFAGAAEWHDAVRREGEPWTFGLHPAEVPGYLRERRLDLIDDLSTRAAARRLLPPSRRAEPTAEFYRVARAVVAAEPPAGR